MRKLTVATTSRVLIPILALFTSPRIGRAQSVWPVAAKPITSIGSAEGGADQMLANVSGARRLSDGRVLVANGKPLELRLYSVRGTLVSRIGRMGSGPGEFRGRLDLLPAGGDSVLVYDQGNERMSLFGTDGKLIHEWPGGLMGSPRGQTVLYRRSFADAVVPSLAGCLRQALAALPVVAVPALREVHRDASGHYLVRIDGSSTWTAYSARGVALGTVRMPPRFEVYQVGRDFVVGKALLEDDVEQIQVLSVAIPAPSAARETCTGRSDSFPEAHSPRADEFRTALRAAMTAGEMAYSNYASYPSSIDSLPQLEDKLPGGAIFRAFRGSNRGWAAAIYDRRSTLVCVFALAAASFPGWSDGRIRCSE